MAIDQAKFDALINAGLSEKAAGFILAELDALSEAGPGGGATPTLAEVLAEDNEADGADIRGVMELEADSIDLDGDGFGRAFDVGDIETPEEATAEDVAVKLNALFDNLRGSGLMNTGGPA